jgi:hypothetical protein
VANRPHSYDAAKLDKHMLGRMSGEEEFRVSMADIKAGRALTAGQQFPMIGNPVE